MLPQSCSKLPESRLAGSCPGASATSLLEQLGQVGERAEVPQLVAVDDAAGRDDLPVLDLQRHHADQPAVGGEEQRARLTVDARRPDRAADLAQLVPSAAKSLPILSRPTIGRGQAAWSSPASPTTTASAASIDTSPSMSPAAIAAKNRSASSALLLRDASNRRWPAATCLRARYPSCLHASSRAADDAGHLVVAVAEDVMQQEHGPLDRRQPLEQQQEGHRHGVRLLGQAGRVRPDS